MIYNFLYVYMYIYIHMYIHNHTIPKQSHALAVGIPKSPNTAFPPSSSDHSAIFWPRSRDEASHTWNQQEHVLGCNI